MTRPLLVVPLVALAGCGDADGFEPPELRIAQARIDPDVELTGTPGGAAGAHLEYQAGGHWRLFLTCDTELSGYVCDFDVVLSVEPPATLSRVTPEELEPDDYWWRVDRGAVQLLSYTAYDEDGLRFASEPGEPLRVDILLDGQYVPGAIAWSGDGAVQTSAPSQPFELVPDER